MVRLGQNFLADGNLLAAIVRDAGLDRDDVVLEIGGGEGALSAELARRARAVHVVELDERLRAPLERLAAEHPAIRLHFADALRIDLAALEPPPSALVANLPYSVATPLLVRTVCELGSLRRWTAMVQREIAERLRAGPGSKLYGAPSVVLQLACRIEVVRRVDPAVFRPRPRVDSAVVRLERFAPAPPAGLHRLVRAAFAHRRKALAGSLELASPGWRERVQAALAELGLPAGARAEQLSPEQFRRLWRQLEPAGTGEHGGQG